MRAHTKSAIRLLPEKLEGSAMSASQRFDRFLRKLAAVKSCREHPLIPENQFVTPVRFYLHL
jgi:hypothetical protein